LNFYTNFNREAVKSFPVVNMYCDGKKRAETSKTEQNGAKKSISKTIQKN